LTVYRNRKSIDLIDMLLSELKKYKDAINSIKKDIVYVPIELKKKLKKENITLNLFVLDYLS